MKKFEIENNALIYKYQSYNYRNREESEQHFKDDLKLEPAYLQTINNKILRY